MKTHCILAAASLSLLACGTTREATEPASAGRIGVFKSDAAGFDTQTWWYDSGQEVVVFDGQFTPALATQAIAAIRASTSSPITTLVITHPNPDKFNGASAFQAIGAKVVASKATTAAIPGVHAYKRYYFVEMAKMFSADTYPAEAKVDTIFEGSTTLAGGTVELRELANSGVSSTQTIAIIRGAKSLFVGDLVHHRAHAWLEGGIVEGAPRPDIERWVAALGELESFSGYRVHGGRGEVASVEEAVPAAQTYLRGMRSLVENYVRALPDRAVLRGANAGEHWKAIGDQARTAYPEHALSYLIDYGVYGLALSL